MIPRRTTKKDKLMKHLKSDLKEVWALRKLVFILLFLLFGLPLIANFFWWPILYTIQTGHTPNFFF